MTNIRLAYAHLNLRWNPFGAISIEDTPQLAVVAVEAFVERLQRSGFALQFLGEPGRGKTTHLLALREYFPQAPYLHFLENAEIPEIPQAPLLFLDDTQNISASLRKRIFARQVSLVIGTQVDHSRELIKAGLQYYSVRLEGNTIENIDLIIQRRIEWARRSPGPVPAVSRDEIARLIKAYNSDTRAILARLYEEFQTLETIPDGKL
jgi:hypothetical protein